MPAEPDRVPWQPWEAAWREALYGGAGFYRRPEGPGGHFRTAAHAAGPELAAALRRMAAAAGCATVLDVGAGRGELLAAMAGLPRQAQAPRLHGVDLVPRPKGLPDEVGWSTGLAAVPGTVWDGRVLLVAWELLDVVPCPVLELDDAGRPRTVLVDPRTGRERLGGAPPAAELAWCREWWPAGRVGRAADRIEVGLPRDALWAELAGLVRDGVLLAVDYAHTAADRPAAGSLTGFRRGRAVPPVPDGGCDVTAHVAIDSVAAAGVRAGAGGTRLLRQAEALAALGVRDGELLDPGGLGGFSWLEQARVPSSVPGRQRSGPPAPGPPARPATGRPPPRRGD